MKSISVQPFDFQISFKEVLSLPRIFVSSSSLSLALCQTKQCCDAEIALAQGDAKEGIFRGEGSDLVFNTKSSRDGNLHSATNQTTTAMFNKTISSTTRKKQN